MEDTNGALLRVRIEEAGYEPGRPYLRGISFEVRAGERLGLLGPNGAGKSTVMKGLACVRLLLKYSVGIRSKPKGRRPLLSFAGRKLFRGRDLPRRIAELGVKAGLRESGNMSTLMQLALVGAAALLLIPFWTGLIVWLALGALAQLWIHGQWRQWEEERYVSMLPWPSDALSKAEEAGRMAFFLPLFELWGAVLGAKAGLAYGGWGWLAVPALLALGRPLAGYVNGAANRILRRRHSRRRTATEGHGSNDAESARR